MVARYHDAGVSDRKVVGEIADVLDQVAREGARLMLERALAAEVDEFLGRECYARGGEFRGYRNGYGRARTVAVGTGAVPVRSPRVSDVPEGMPAFESAVLPKRKRLSLETQKLFCQLYLEGLSTGDFEPIFRQLLGETAPLSPNTIVRLKQEWEQEYEAWRRLPLDLERYVYAWADGIYLGAGLEKQNSCLLTIVAARADGTKELLAMEIGYRESKASWADLLRDLRDRGLRSPLLWIGDGNLGLWGGLDEVFPDARRQRCWNHRMLNVEDELPKRLHSAARPRLYELYQAPTRERCEALRDELAAWLRSERQVAAADTLYRDWEDFVTFYDFHEEHWLHIRTTNPLESVFAGVRLRTDVAKRARKRENALYLVYKIVRRLSNNWQGLNGGPRLMQIVLAGAVFMDGVLMESDQAAEVMSA